MQCPVCSVEHSDLVAHFLTEHPDSHVPQQVALQWVLHDRRRCRHCFQLDPHEPIVFNQYHRLRVKVDLSDPFGFCCEFSRQSPFDLFHCAWCASSFRNGEAFQVRSLLSRSRRFIFRETDMIIPPFLCTLQQHVHRCAFLNLALAMGFLRRGD